MLSVNFIKQMLFVDSNLPCKFCQWISLDHSDVVGGFHWTIQMLKVDFAGPCKSYWISLNHANIVSGFH